MQHFSLKLICFLSPLDSWINTLSLPFEKRSHSKGFFCPVQLQPSFQIRPEQAAQSEHIYSTNVTPFCSQSTRSNLRLLIYLFFAIIHQAILATDCFLDLPATLLKRVSNFHFVGTATQRREPEGQDTQASLVEWLPCNDRSQNLLTPLSYWPFLPANSFAKTPLEMTRQPMQLRQIQCFIQASIQGN